MGWLDGERLSLIVCGEATKTPLSHIDDRQREFPMRRQSTLGQFRFMASPAAVQHLQNRHPQFTSVYYPLFRGVGERGVKGTR